MNIVGDQLDATTGGPNQGIFLKHILCLIIKTGVGWGASQVAQR